MPSPSTVSQFPIPSLGLPKVRREMRRLQIQVGRCWAAANESSVTLCREHGLEFEMESFLVDLSPALVSVRAIDEAFASTTPRADEHDPASSAYNQHALGSPEGRATVGLAVLRNAEIHDTVIVDPEVVRVISSAGGKGRAFPAWRQIHELTPEARVQGKWRHSSYASDVAGRLVIETLLDAIAFFVACDPEVATCDEAGALDGFPLPRLIQFGYERRHPDWPRQEQADVKLRSTLQQTLPGGHRRVAVGALRDEAGVLEAICGWTIMDYGRGQSFTEALDQVKEDIAQGYIYGTAGQITDAYDLSITLDSLNLDDVSSLADAETDQTLHWRLWWDHAREDAGFYRNQRQPI